MSDTTFLNLVRGNTLANYMGLRMDEGAAFRYASDYTYVEIPLSEMYNVTEEKVVEKALRNQKLRVIPACKVSPRNGYKVIVRTNPKLQEVANCSAMLLIDAGEDGTPSFSCSFQKDFDTKDLDWAVRLYLVG